MEIRVLNSKHYSDYFICPKLYYYNYIEEYNEVLGLNTESTKIGDLIHRIIDLDFNNFPFIDKYLKMEPELRPFWDFYLKNYKLDNNSDVFSEWSFHLPIETEIEKVILTGRVDRFIKDNDKLIIYDWKTGKNKNKLSIILNNLQLDYYAYALSKIFSDYKQIETKIVYLGLKKEESRILHNNDLLEIEKNIISFIKNSSPLVENFILNPLKVDNIPFCKICNFFKYCENLL